MKTKTATYTATFDDTGAVIYARRPSGNLIGELPLGARPNKFNQEPEPGTDFIDSFKHATGVTASGRSFTICRDGAAQRNAEVQAAPAQNSTDTPDAKS